MNLIKLGSVNKPKLEKRNKIITGFAWWGSDAQASHSLDRQGVGHNRFHKES